MTQSLSAMRALSFFSLFTFLIASAACGSADVTPSPEGEGDISGIAEESDSSQGSGEVSADAGPSEGDAPEQAEPEDTSAECAPSCEGMTCGDDGCGGSCGECAAGEVCNDSGMCEEDSSPCVPACEDKVCGDDGCGGSCGECGEGTSCNAGACDPDESCVPACGDKVCGDDGCGGSCGACAEGETCTSEGACETALEDPCDPNPCTEPPADTCEGATPLVYEPEGECIFIGDTSSCSYTFSEGEPCEGDTFCSEGACVTGGPPSEFGADASVITEMVIAAANEPEDCCFDFDNDGQVDNGVGNLLGTLGSFLGDVDLDGSLAEAIGDGSVTIVLEAIGVDDVENDDSVDVQGYVGYYDDEGDLLIQPGSFNPDGTPLVYFAEGEISDGTASMGPSDFQTSLPLAGFNLSLEVKEARGQTEVSVSEDGGKFDMSDGKLGGLIPFGDIVSTLNMVAGSCDCLDLGGNNMFDLTGEDSIACSGAFNDASPSCSDADGSLCTGLAGIADQKFLVCNIGLGLIKPDIDTDFNGKGDHFSVGLRFTGEADTIAGMGEDQSISGCGDCSGGGGPLNMLAHLALFAMCFAFVTRKRRA